MEVMMTKRAVVAVVSMMMTMIILSGLQVADGQSVCNVPISGLMSCRDAATPPNPPPPSRACCSTLTHADLQCLCRYKNSNILPSVGIDPNLAMQLPAKCKIPLPRSC